MERVRVASLLFLPFLLPALLVSGQNNHSAPTQDQPSAPASSTQAQHAQTPAPPFSSLSPRLSTHTRLEIIRDFETQIFYSRASFPMGIEGLKLKVGVATPNG